MAKKKETTIERIYSVADFVGSPSINFVDAVGEQLSPGNVSLSILPDIPATFRFKDQIDNFISYG